MDNPGNDRQALAHIKTRHTNPTFSDTCTPRPLGTNDALPVAISKRVRRIMRVRFFNRPARCLWLAVLQRRIRWMRTLCLLLL